MLTDAERAVLTTLSESRSTATVVRLAADLYERGSDRDDRFTHGDPIGFVTWLLESLNENGYVIYRVDAPRNHDHDAIPGFAGLPYAIHLTPKGWAECGYKHITHEVGHNAGLREVRQDDRTDFRTHHVFAEGGPIEHHPWYDCYLIVPLSGKEITVAQPATRAYVKVTPDMEDRVLASYGRTGSYEKTAREVNLDVRRVRYIVNDRPRLGRDSSSLKQRLLDLIAERGPYFDIYALHKDIPGPHGLHNLVHLLHSLNKSGLIEFRTDAKGRDTNYLNIRLREGAVAKKTNGHLPPIGVDSVAVLTLDPAPVAPTPTPEVVPTPVEPTPEVAITPKPINIPEAEVSSPSPYGGGRTESRTFPLLDELLSQREVSRLAGDAAAQYLAAAEALSVVDPVMAETLLSKAAAIEGTGPSPIEAEYLAYHDAYPDE